MNAAATIALVPSALAARVTSPAAYGDPDGLHETFRWLRANAPVARVQTADFGDFWLVTKHADILDIERQPEIFSNGDQSTVLVPEASLAMVREMMGGSPHLTRSMVNMDGDEHLTYRILTQGWFMPGNLKKLKARIRAIARTHVERMFDRGGRCDFVTDVALHYPLHVVMEILGVPEEDEPRMLMLTQQLFGARDPELTRSAETLKDNAATARMLKAVLEDFSSYFRALTDSRRAAPRDDVASIIANAVIDGKPISDHEAMSYYVLIATAGHDTTSASTAGAIWALAERPEELAKVRANPALIPGLVDESIRWVTPVKHFMRSATCDYDLHGQAIKAGDWLMLNYMSANRDEDVFEDPYAFRVDRPAAKHLAFGYGPHVCLGQHLAKLEMRVLLEELIPRLAQLKLDGSPAWTQSSFVSGPKRLPIQFAS